MGLISYDYELSRKIEALEKELEQMGLPIPKFTENSTPQRTRQIVEYELAVARQKLKPKKPNVVGLSQYDYELNRKIEALEKELEQMGSSGPMVLSGSARNRQNIEGGMLTKESKLQPNNKPIPVDFLNLFKLPNSFDTIFEIELNNDNSNEKILI